jgi:hypothetical protein
VHCFTSTAFAVRRVQLLPELKIMAVADNACALLSCKAAELDAGVGARDVVESGAVQAAHFHIFDRLCRLRRAVERFGS